MRPSCYKTLLSGWIQNSDSSTTGCSSSKSRHSACVVGRDIAWIWISLNIWFIFCYQFKLAHQISSSDCAKLYKLTLQKRILMGYCKCRRSESPPLFPVLLILALVAALIAIPLPEPEPIYVHINWPLIAAPLLLLAIVHCLSSARTPPRYCAPPTWGGCRCKGMKPCWCGRF